MKNNLLITTALVVATSATIAQANSTTTSPWALEMAGGYQFAVKEFQKDPAVSYPMSGGTTNQTNVKMPKLDLITADLTGVYNFNNNHALTLRFGFGAGDDTVPTSEHDAYVKDEVDLFTLMPGYRLTIPFYQDKIKAFAGVNVGLAYAKYKSEQYGLPAGHANNTKVDDSAWGFAYSTEIGLLYDITDRVGVFVAYQFSGNTVDIARHNYNHVKGGPDQPTHKQIYNGVRAGLSYNF